jgi:glucose/arabinose dehydrogenase/cytochrome c5
MGRPSGFTTTLALLACGLSAALLRSAVPEEPNGGITLPAGFHATVFADRLGSLRFLAVSPEGNVYAKTKNDGIIALRDTNGDGKADEKAVFGSGGGTGIAVRDGYLYHSTDDTVYRYALAPGDLAPKGAPEVVVANLPDEGQHSAKSFAFDDTGRLYVEVGSPSNSYGGRRDRALGAKGEDPTEFFKTHGGFWRFDPSRLHQTEADAYHFSTGQRHVLSIAWNPVARAFFIVMMGRDQLNTVDPAHYTDDDNAELPAEEMHLLREGGSLGWPYTYWDPQKKARMVSPEYGGDNKKTDTSGKYPDPLVAFPAHWAPLQMAFDQGAHFPAKYRGGAFIAFHGSWNRAPKPQRGYNVTFVPFDGKGMPQGTYEVFASGFPARGDFTNPGDARYRPCGLAFGPDGALFVSDSEKGRIWRITYTGEAAPAASPSTGPSPAKAAPAAPAPKGPGAELYARTCGACHMADGRGIPNLQPALKGSPILADSRTVVRLLLRGPKGVLPADRMHYPDPMPPFDALSDEEIASVVTYVRKTFGGKGDLTSRAEVAALRASP